MSQWVSDWVCGWVNEWGKGRLIRDARNVKSTKIETMKKQLPRLYTDKPIINQKNNSWTLGFIESYISHKGKVLNRCELCCWCDRLDVNIIQIYLEAPHLQQFKMLDRIINQLIFLPWYRHLIDGPAGMLWQSMTYPRSSRWLRATTNVVNYELMAGHLKKDYSGRSGRNIILG